MFPAAVAVNFLLGVLYAWSLFLSPLELMLSESRTLLSVVPGLGLLCFTVGVFVHGYLIRCVAIRWLAPGALALSGLGHFIFWLFPTYTGLLLGYGFVLGLAAGVGYGVALAMAGQVAPALRGLAIGFTVAAFAASGMTISILGTIYDIPNDITRLFGSIGILFFVCAVIFLRVLWNSVLISDSVRKTADQEDAIRLFPILCLAIGYFSLCYPGLMFVGHGTTMLHAMGAPSSLASLAPFILNAGYIIGALAGGILPSHLPGKSAPLAFLSVTAISMGLLLISLPLLLYVVAIFVIGAGLGSVVSVFLLLLKQQYNADRSHELFGRLNIGYGLAGISAPFITGALYDVSGSYHTSLWFTLFVCMVGVIAIAGSRTSLSTTRPNYFNH